jgi:hypothetical protein
MNGALAIRSDALWAMSEDVKKGLLAAYRHLLRPLVRVLIRNGVAFGEYVEATKQVFVASAREDFTLPNKKMSGSRVAILTGLTRKDVKRLMELLDSGLDQDTGHVHRAARVLEGWHKDPDFTGPYGIPVELVFEGSPISFSELVRKYSGDMPARAMLEELKRVAAVTESEDGKIKALSRYYISSELDPANAKYFGDVIHDLASTLEYNFNVDKESSQRFERWVMNERLDEKAMLEFQELVNKHGQQFLELLDGWLSRNEVPADKLVNKALKVTRVGVYLYEADSDGSSER